ncbi:MAG: neutral/alkaline non-lysosomal ceramidase N-terminal domain-containing protein [Bacteroidales bacterium]|nr:neutral/alkaline non-lysosomal ceramidase N-terminal domain-containing protein [Bacteroidales bacterium]
MKSTIVKPALSVLFILIVLSANAQLDSTHIRSEWKAGVARVLITPEQPMWAAGYAARDHQIDSILHDLWVKALAIEDGEGSKALMISADLLGFPKALSDGIRDRLEKEYELSRAQIILSGTHTHSGPVLEDALYDIYPLDAQDIPIIEQYSDKLADQIVALAGEALSSMEPVQIYTQNGVTRFQVNRRNNDASTLDAQSELKGPSDHAVPVIKVVDQEGNIMAVTFGYACHPTVLDQYEWSGDYPGFSMIELERLYPGTTALFFSGAGADQNPLPRRSIGLAKQYGKELAAAVERVLEEDMRELSPTLAVSYSEIELPLNPPPSLNELHEYAEAPEDYVRRWAEKMIDKMEQEESFINSYPYPLQVWHMGDQMLVNMGGEVVVEYAIKLKQIFGQDIFVFAYSNDEVAYIPSVTIIEEGGYEGLISQMVYGLPGTWKADIESMIIQEIVRLAGKNGTQEQNANVPTALSRH